MGAGESRYGKRDALVESRMKVLDVTVWRVCEKLHLERGQTTVVAEPMGSKAGTWEVRRRDR